MPERPVRTIDHVVHAVDDLDEAATAYEGLGFTVTPRADHPFGTSNRLVVLQDTYIEIVSVTDPQRIPTAGFAAGVTSRLRERGSGISHVVLSSSDPASDLAELGPLATGEIFSFSRPAPQVDGTEVRASFECTFAKGTVDLGMFLCRHMVPTAVWNERNQWHPNRALHIEELSLPVQPSTLDTLATMARTRATDQGIQAGSTWITTGPAAIRFDTILRPIEIGGVAVGGGVD